MNNNKFFLWWNLSKAKALPYLLLFIIMGCGLNNPFTPPKPPMPSPPELTAPADSTSIGQDIRVTFRWEKVLGSLQYRFQISKTADFNNLITDIPGLQNEQKEAAFSDTGEYFWRVEVQTKAYKQWSDWSEIWSFRIVKDTALPLVPYNPFPWDNAGNVITNLDSLSWESGDAQDTVTYFIYLGQDSFSWEIEDTIVDGRRQKPVTVLYQLPTVFNANTTYFWQVKAKDADGLMATGPVWRFTTGVTGANSPPVISQPSCPDWVYADEECISKVVATDPDGDSVSYQLQIEDSITSWTTPFTASGDTVEIPHIYRYFKAGYIPFKVKARAIDSRFAKSGWSTPCSVKVKANAGTCAVADYGEADIMKISARGSILCKYDRPAGGSFAPCFIAIDTNDASIWATSTGENRVNKISACCTFLLECPSNSNPNPDLAASMPLDLEVAGDGDLWVCLAEKGKIVKLDKDNCQTNRPINVPNCTQLIRPMVIAVDEVRNAIWVGKVDISQGGSTQILKYDLIQNSWWVCQLSGFKGIWLALNPQDGYCWVADAYGGKRVVKISPNGDMTVVAADLLRPNYISLYPNGGYAWVADSCRVIKLPLDGTSYEVANEEFEDVLAVEVDSRDGSCWVVDKSKKTVSKLGFAGNKLFEIEGFGEPYGIAVNPNPDP